MSRRLQTRSERRSKPGSRVTGGQGRVETLSLKPSPSTGRPSKAQYEAMDTITKRYGVDEFLNAPLRDIIDRAPKKVLAQLGKMAVASREAAYGTGPRRQAGSSPVNPGIRGLRPQKGGLATAFSTAYKGERYGNRAARDVFARQPLTDDYTQWAGAPGEYDYAGLDDGSREAINKQLRAAKWWREWMKATQEKVTVPPWQKAWFRQFDISFVNPRTQRPLSERQVVSAYLRKRAELEKASNGGEVPLGMREDVNNLLTLVDIEP